MGRTKQTLGPPKKITPLRKRQLVLTVTTTVSGILDDGNEVGFGDVYEDFDNDDISLKECLQAGETSFRRACAELLLSYIIENAEECFETITGYASEDTVELNGPVTVDRNTGRLSFPFHEIIALDDDDSCELRENIIDEINCGAAYGGDFGRVERLPLSTTDSHWEDANADIWDRWIGRNRKCHAEVPNLNEGTYIGIDFYLAIEPEIKELSSTEQQV